MVSLSSGIFYILIFLAVYVQVFFLVTFIENRKKIIIRNGKISLGKYPAVTIVVPCWNESNTVFRTVKSILGLNYPKDKIKIFLVDDGSTDDTWQVIKRFSKYPNIKIFRKENGGKHTALNLALEHTETDFVGCLDADSVVDKEALVRIMSYFEKDEEAMAVTPSIIVNNPKGAIQNAQRVEYQLAIFAKRVLGFLGGIHVTPGPFTIFRTKVFEDLGPYEHAHNTEDMEIAYRMQKHRYKIDYCNDAYVYTNTPATAYKLYRQRLRWIYGFINNTIDYRDVLFQKKYGYFSTFTVPAGILSIFTAGFLIGRLLYQLIDFVLYKINAFRTVGPSFQFNGINFDLFFIETDIYVFVTLFLYAMVVFSILIGRRIIEGKWGLSFSTLYFFVVFSFVAPFWLVRAIWNTIVAQKPSWR